MPIRLPIVARGCRGARSGCRWLCVLANWRAGVTNRYGRAIRGNDNNGVAETLLQVGACHFTDTAIVNGVQQNDNARGFGLDVHYRAFDPSTYCILTLAS